MTDAEDPPTPGDEAEPDQGAVKVTVGSAQPIIIEVLDFAAHSRKFQRQLLASATGKAELKLQLQYDEDSFKYDSVLQFFTACRGDDPELTLDNIFEFRVLCDEWNVDTGIRKKVTSFLEDHVEELLIPGLLFQLKRKLPSKTDEGTLCDHLMDFIGNSRLAALPLEVLDRVIDFGRYQDDPSEFRELFDFCITYLDDHGSSGSLLFKSVNVARLSLEDLHTLCSRPAFQRRFLNDSAGEAIRALETKIDAMSQEIAALRAEVAARSTAQEAPDWSRKASKSWGSQLVAEENGWVYAECRSYSGSPGYLKIGGQQYTVCRDDSSYYPYASIWMPIVRGEGYQATGGNSAQSLYIVPGRPNSVIRAPDYAKREQKSWGSELTAEDDGWVYVESGTYTSSSYIGYVTIGGQQFLISRSDSNYYWYSSKCMPVLKGQKYQGSGGYQANVIYFIPCRDSVVRPPDWPRQAAKSWGSQLSADEDGWVYVEGAGYSSSHIVYLTVNGQQLQVCRNDSSDQAYGSLCLPLLKGDSYKATGGYKGQEVHWIPSRR